MIGLNNVLVSLSQSNKDDIFNVREVNEMIHSHFKGEKKEEEEDLNGDGFN